MKYLRSYSLFESVNLLVSDIDRYKPMFKLMSDLLALSVDKNQLVSSNSEPFKYIYDILLHFDNFFNNRNLKIGDVKYSLNAPGDNELNKLKELNKIYIGNGEDVTFNPDLYFEDIKFIDWLLYKVESGDYHIKVEPSFVSWGKNHKNIWTPSDKKSIEVIDEFKNNLNNLELFYNKFGKFNRPKFTIEDVEDMLLEFTDSKSISNLRTYLDYRFKHVIQSVEKNGEFKHLKTVDPGNDLFYIVSFDIILKDEYDESTKIVDLIVDRIGRDFELLSKNLFYPYQDFDTYEWKKNVTLRLIQK